VSGKQHSHAECPAKVSDRLSDGAFTNNAECRAVQVPDRVSEKRELSGSLPLAGGH
jgi:hypothetical protein